jgi:hypothetical protein
MSEPPSFAVRARQQGDPPPAPEKPETPICIFRERATVDEITNAAAIVRKLGFEPELRIGGSCDQIIELYTADVPAMIARLRASLTETKPRP